MYPILGINQRELTAVRWMKNDLHEESRYSPEKWHSIYGR